MKKSYQTSESAGVATNKELVHERPAHVSTIAWQNHLMIEGFQLETQQTTHAYM